jgi:hypothetical protein
LPAASNTTSAAVQAQTQAAQGKKRAAPRAGWDAAKAYLRGVAAHSARGRGGCRFGAHAGAPHPARTPSASVARAPPHEALPTHRPT